MADNPYAKYANPYAGLAPIGTDPTKPLDIRSKQIGVQKGEAELQLSPYELRKQKAEATKAELEAQTAQEAYDAAHPKGSTATVLGPDSLKSLSVPDQELVKALADGRLAFPAGFALKAPWWQQKLEQVAAFDPTFDATNYNNRAKARAMLLTGKVGTSANALNTSIGHLGTLASQVSGTASHAFTPANAIENYVDQHYLGQSGITNFKDTAGKLASELTSVYRNGGGAEADVVRQLQSLDPNASAKQKTDVIRNALDLLASKQAANLYQYSIGSGGKPTVDFLDPDARKILDQFPDIRDKHFGAQPPGLSQAAASLLQSNGGTPPPPPGPPPADPSAPPPIGPQGAPPGVPHADYSGMIGGPQQTVATSGYRNQYDPVGAAALSAFIKHGAPYETAAAYAQSHGFNPPPQDAYMAAVAFQKQHPNAQPNVEANRNVPTTFGQRVAASPAAAALAGGVTGATAGLSDVAGRSIAGPQWDANRAAMAATNPGSDLAGNVIGGIGGMFAGGKLASSALAAGAQGGLARNALALALKNPVKAGVLGDTAYGGVYGASENPDDPLAGAGAGILTAPIASLAGQGAAKGLGAVSRGVVDPAVQRLRAAGIPLTVGEVIGGGAKKAQDAMTSVFGPGNMVARRYAEGRQAMNQAAFNQAGGIVGSPINKVGNAGIQALDAAKSRAYSNALDPVSLNLNNPQAIGDIGNALNSAKAIPNVDQARDIATGGLANYIGGAAPNGIMGGADFQQSYRGLSRLANQSSNRVYGHEIGGALGQGKDALVSALQEQNPGAFQGFQQANSANRHLSVLSDAVNAAKNQVGDNGEPLFTPAQLGTAATANAKRFGSNIGAASGDRPFNQLALDSQKVMSSKLPESGTFPRQLMGLALTGGLSGAGGMFGGSQNGAEGAAEGAAIPLGLLTLLGTRRGQQLLTASLLKRPDAMRQFGGYLMAHPQSAGDLATAGSLQFLPQP